MLNINFVPDDYLQNNESRRTNLMYIILFAVVMLGISGTFTVIKLKQKALAEKEKIVNEKIAKAQDSIKQFEELQTKRKTMIKTAMATAELIEPVPRSILLALLTNNLPRGVSLTQVTIIQKEPKTAPGSQQKAATNNYLDAKAKAKEAAGKNGTAQSGTKAVLQANQQSESPEKLLQTYIDIDGVASSDIQVAKYIEQLGDCALLENVALVESKETKAEESARQFRLTASLKKDISPSKEDIAALCDKNRYVEKTNLREESTGDLIGKGEKQ